MTQDEDSESDYEYSSDDDEEAITLMTAPIPKARKSRKAVGKKGKKKSHPSAPHPNAQVGRRSTPATIPERMLSSTSPPITDPLRIEPTRGSLDTAPALLALCDPVSLSPRNPVGANTELELRMGAEYANDPDSWQWVRDGQFQSLPLRELRHKPGHRHTSILSPLPLSSTTAYLPEAPWDTHQPRSSIKIIIS
jgi:hypothetical protein